MPRPRRHASPDISELVAGFQEIRRQFELRDEFDAETIAEAETATPTHEHADRTTLPFISLDPAGSRDLDQALYIERMGSTLRLHYAIADVATWVVPGGAIDAEAERRGSTIYCPDRRIPLHPPVLSEGRASLLADQDVPAVLWRIDIADDGTADLVDVERALVRNRAALSYVDADAALASGTADDLLNAVVEVGQRREAVEAARGGVDLRLPEQDVVFDQTTGRAEIVNRAPLPIENHNAQLSLTCGMMAARTMLDSGVGLLRTMPEASAEVVAELTRLGAALGVPRRSDERLADWIRRLDPATPIGVALLTASAKTLRGAGYESFDGAPPGLSVHSAIAAPYAHVTAPLRRRADRYATECVLAAVAGRRPPEWVLAELDELPAAMGAANQTASGVDNACVDLTEAVVLAPLIGSTRNAVVVGPAIRGAVAVFLDDPVVLARAAVASDPPVLGERVSVHVDGTNIDKRTVSLSVAASRHG